MVPYRFRRGSYNKIINISRIESFKKNTQTNVEGRELVNQVERSLSYFPQAEITVLKFRKRSVIA